MSENYSVNCTHLEDKMKAFAALFFLGALAAYVSANEMTFHRAVKNFLDERHDERMSQVARDHGLLEPDTYVARDHKEPPAFMVRKNQILLFWPPILIPVTLNQSIR